MGKEITYYEVRVLGNTTMEFVIHALAAFPMHNLMNDMDEGEAERG